jgi:MFS family permease
MYKRPLPHNPLPESRYEVLALFTGAMIGASLLVMSTGPLLPFLGTAFHLGQTQLGLVLSVQMAGSVLMTAVAGMLTDRYGDKAVVLWTGFVMGTALIAASLVHNFGWLLFWLLMYGIGFAAVTPSGSHAIVYFFKKEERGVAMGIRQCGVPLAGVVGSLLLPAVAAHFDYEWALVVAGVVTIVSCVATSLLYREPIELEGEQISVIHMLDEMLQMARNARLLLMTLSAMGLVCGQLAVMAFLTLTIVRDTNVALFGAVALFTLSQFAAIAGRVFWGWSSDRIFGGSRALPLAAVAVITGVLSLFASSVGTSTAFWIVAVLAALLGFTAEGWFGLAVLGVAEIGGEAHCGSALGVALTFIFFAAFLAPTVIGALAQAHGYPFAWRCVAVIQFAAMIPALLASAYIRRYSQATA